MTMNVIKGYNVANIVKGHSDKWVALSKSGKKVLASADTLDALATRVDKAKVVFMRVLPGDVNFAPRAYEV